MNIIVWFTRFGFLLSLLCRKTDGQKRTNISTSIYKMVSFEDPQQNRQFIRIDA